MNYDSQQRLATFDCVGQYFVQHPLDPPNALATALIAELASIADAMRANGAIQATAFTGFRGGTDERQFAFTLVLDDMRVLSLMAKGVNRSEHPGLKELFRMPRSRSFVHLAAQARAFSTNLSENEAIFTARSLPAGFIAAFDAKVSAAEAAVADRNAGIINRAGATAALKAKASRGVAILQELDGIMAASFLADPQSLAAWKTARRIARRGRAKKKTPSVNGEAGDPTSAFEEANPLNHGNAEGRKRDSAHLVLATSSDHSVSSPPLSPPLVAGSSAPPIAWRREVEPPMPELRV